METEDQDVADRRNLLRRKISDVAGLLPIAGAILLASPLVIAITGGEDGALYPAALSLFAVWGGLIAAAFMLARFLWGETGRE